MMRFIEFLGLRRRNRKKNLARIQLCEHVVYTSIPGTNNSFRVDAGNTNTATQRHLHAYARPMGGGSELYAVNIDGTGHDGSSGIEIPKSHADYFRNRLAFNIPQSNIIERLEMKNIHPERYSWILIENSEVK
jgi:hypothetical protein